MITKALIEQKVTEEDIFRRYIGHSFKMGVPFLSELRSEYDPSANIFRSDTGTLLYKDFTEDRAMNCYGYVMEKFNIDFYSALNLIANDFGISDTKVNINKTPAIVIPKIIKDRAKSSYQYEIKPWEKHELAFWKRFGIPQEVLEEYDIHPLHWIQTIKDDIAYNPIESFYNYPIFLIKIMDGLKIYFPLEENPQRKWLSNTSVTDIFGLKQAIKATATNKLNMLGLLAGQKDVLSLYSNTGIRSICLSSEGAKLRFNVFAQMCDISEWQFILYDNDKTGTRRTRKLASEFPLTPIFLYRFLGYSTLKGSSGINDVSDWYEYMQKRDLKVDRISILINEQKSQL